MTALALIIVGWVVGKALDNIADAIREANE